MTLHRLKTWPEAFADVESGRKNYEIRSDDRDFAVGDLLLLLEWVPSKYTSGGAYTGGAVLAEVLHKTKGGEWGLPERLCVLGIRLHDVGEEVLEMIKKSDSNAVFVLSGEAGTMSNDEEDKMIERVDFLAGVDKGISKLRADTDKALAGLSPAEQRIMRMWFANQPEVLARLPAPKATEEDILLSPCTSEEADPLIRERASRSPVSERYRWIYKPDQRLNGWVFVEDKARFCGQHGWGCYVQGPERFALKIMVPAWQAVSEWIAEFYPNGFDAGPK